MAGGAISEDDVQIAAERLRSVLEPWFCKNFFGRDTLDRLARIIGVPTISDAFLLPLLVFQKGASMLAEQPRRMGATKTSIRKELVKKLPDGDLQALYARVIGPNYPGPNVARERLATFRWMRGSPKARALTRAVGLPMAFAGSREGVSRGISYEVDLIGALPTLKPYQRGILREIRSRLWGGGRVMVSAFTGTGKTRLGMEYAVDCLLRDEDDPLVVWVAQKSELLDQACDSMEQLWPWLGQESGKALQVYRYWGATRFSPELPEQPTLVVASSQQLLARTQANDPFASAILSRARLLVIDEAHHALATGHQGIIAAYEGAGDRRTRRTLGLSATPGRSNLVDAQQSRKLAELFHRTLIVPHVAERGGALKWFQDAGYLSHISHRDCKVQSQVAQTLGKLKRAHEVEKQAGYRDYTLEFLGVVGEDSMRNRAILKELSALHTEGRHLLVFCCNIAQAELLSQALTLQGTTAGLIHHEIDKRDRQHTIAQFRRGQIRVLLNVEVLTTGFDAPKVDTIVMCRPTLSRVLYEQMVGRGMRGPQMGGTESCLIVDFTTNFGKFDEPQAWEAFWKEWTFPESDDLAGRFSDAGWSVVGAQPEAASGVGEGP